MELLIAILLGIIQGITEWLPISSSGHLVIGEHFFGVEVPVFFDVMLHLGSLVVVLILFKKEVMEVISALPVLVSSVRKKEKLKYEIKNNKNVRLLLYLFLGTIPIGISGIVFHLFFMDIFKNLLLVGVALIFTSILLAATKGKEGEKEIFSVNKKNTLLVGLAQAVAIIPGVSRSGSTISAGLLQKFDKEFAYRFSFLLFIPAMIGALVVESLDVVEKGYETELILPTIVGTITSMLTGYLTIKLLHKVVKERKLHLFSPYCLILGFILIIYYLFG
ncbi:MAG TPA: undecaprenyl-diphosphate phosphatase [Thermoplasmata archaeon]|nr:undecaprenyl-diphosphate phosphatase [Thermoplasmata archaeon]